jgi:glutamate-5-semialdehyde dehydrogenase
LSLPLLPAGANVQPLLAANLDREALALALNVLVVADVTAAMAHIAEHGTGHSEAILTETPAHAHQFQMGVDAAVVYVNASTRFSDGGEFGLGAEVAVSTQKLHARGPMALEALTTYKWLGKGQYTIRQG